MPNERPSVYAIEEFAFRGYVHTDRPGAGAGTGSAKFNLSNISAGLSSKALGGYLYSDGATANRAMIQGPFVSGSRGWLAGAAKAQWAGWVNFPSANPAVDLEVFALGPYNNGWLPNAIGQALAGYFPSGSSGFNIVQEGVWNTASRRVFSSTTLRAVYSGVKAWMEVLFTNGTANPVVALDGVDVSALFTPSTSGAVPNWLDSTLQGTYSLAGFNWPAGEIPLGCWINGHMTAAESLAWMNTGKPPAWVQFGGSATEQIQTTDSRTFGGSAGAWQAQGGSVTASGGIGVFTGGSQYYLGNGANSTSEIGNIVAGVKYRVSLTLTANASGLALGGNLGGTNFALGAAVGSYSVEVVAIANNRLNLVLGTFSTSEFRIDDVSIIRVGALSLPRVQCIGVVHDWTEIGGNAARLLGMRGVTENRSWQICADTNVSGGGGTALLGGDLIDSAKDVLSSSIEQTPQTGTPTTSIGHLTGSPTTYKASGALAAGINPFTAVTRKAAGNQIWIFSNTTDVVRTTLSGHRAN